MSGTNRYRFALADARDDAQLRERMARDWLKGNISISFRREPRYFDACQVQGESAQVIKCIDEVKGRIVGLGSRLVSTAFVNGRPQRLGYLADLRADPASRGSGLLARGYRFLRELHNLDPVPLYYSVILEGNAAALHNLVGGRAGLPEYKSLGRVLTPAIHLDVPKREIVLPHMYFERARPEQLRDILEFIRTWQSQKQFSPAYRASDFSRPRLRGLKVEDFYLALRDGRIVGTVAAWDQCAFRQTHVERYSPALSIYRPLHNVLARFTPLKPLPALGKVIPYFNLSFIAIEENDRSIFRGLLRALYRDRYRGPWHYFIAGLHERDPLASVLREYRRIEAAGVLFVIFYPDGANAFRELDERVPYVEVATL